MEKCLCSDPMQCEMRGHEEWDLILWRFWGILGPFGVWLMYLHRGIFEIGTQSSDLVSPHETRSPTS